MFKWIYKCIADYPHVFIKYFQTAAKMIKETMDKKFGASWHAVVGEGYGFEITHEVKNLLYMFFGGNMAIVIWKCSWKMTKDVEHKRPVWTYWSCCVQDRCYSTVSPTQHTLNIVYTHWLSVAVGTTHLSHPGWMTPEPGGHFIMKETRHHYVLHCGKQLLLCNP